MTCLELKNPASLSVYDVKSEVKISGHLNVITIQLKMQGLLMNVLNIFWHWIVDRRLVFASISVINMSYRSTVVLSHYR